MKPSAAKELEALPKKDRQRVIAKILRLSKQARPLGSEKLSGEDKYRLRQGDYRILYAIDDDGLTITLVKIVHRREAYRK